MFVPKPSFAKSRIVFSSGVLLLFPAYDLEFCPIEDPYRSTLEELQRIGLHRNLFFLTPTNELIWRISDYNPPLPDAIVGIQRQDNSQEFVSADTFQGSVLQIAMDNGDAKVVGWRKT